MNRYRALVALAWVVTILATGCVKRTIEVRVKDPAWVGVSRIGAHGLEPVLAPGGGQGFARLTNDGLGADAVVDRQPRQMTVDLSGAQPLVLVDPMGTLPPEKPGDGLAMHQGWLYATYKLTPKRVLPASARADSATPIVLMTPVTNIAEVREVREPYHWPAYVFLPVGGTFTLMGAGALTLGNLGNKEENQAAAAGFFLFGIPLVIYGIINALDSTEYVPVATPFEGSF